MTGEAVRSYVVLLVALGTAVGGFLAVGEWSRFTNDRASFSAGLPLGIFASVAAITMAQWGMRRHRAAGTALLGVFVCLASLAWPLLALASWIWRPTWH